MAQPLRTTYDIVLPRLFKEHLESSVENREAGSVPLRKTMSSDEHFLEQEEQISENVKDFGSPADAGNDLEASIQKAKERLDAWKAKFLKEEAENVLRDSQGVLSTPMTPTPFEILCRQGVFVPFQMIKTKLVHDLFNCSFLLENFLGIISREDDETLFQSLKGYLIRTQEVVRHFECFLSDQEECNMEVEIKIAKLQTVLNNQLELVSKSMTDIEFDQFLLDKDERRFNDSKPQLCHALGLSLNFLDRLDSVSETYRDHQTLSEWTLMYLKDDLEEMMVGRDVLTKEDLVRVGFRENSRAVETILRRAQTLRYHVDPVELVLRYVEDEFKFNPNLVFLEEQFLGPLPRFPFHNIPNRSFSLVQQKFNVLNIRVSNEIEGEEFVNHTLSELEDPSCVLRFHGTDHRSADDIIKSGIYVDFGHAKRDFSDGSGFYLSNDFKQSEAFAMYQTRKPAVLVFRVPKESMETARVLDLKSNRQLWEEIVSSFRRGRADANLRKQMRQYDVIEGPVAKVRSSTSEGELIVEEADGSYQCCIRSDEFAEKIQDDLVLAIFYDRPLQSN
ncbi:uncharacterized protein LOC116603668 [Nematostella vectensis]|uniref:uncharacterized protein LOC116603668 n=1 Tax=Nematostella vectensis TaxID=45351 RepID=UPI0013903DEB|nr:uncharacterized protein LOC116603668 [Nematostella vectensis]